MDYADEDGVLEMDHHKLKSRRDEGKDADVGDEKDDDLQPRKPRRERKPLTAEASSPNGFTDTHAPIGKPGRRRRDGEEKENGAGWMALESEGRPRLSTTQTAEVTEAISEVNRARHKDDNDELLFIPDMDDDGVNEDKRTAHAPKNVNRRIPSLIELNNDVKTVISSSELGYDLGVLLNSLVPVEFLNEADTPWTFDSLLQVKTNLKHDVIQPSNAAVQEVNDDFMGEDKLKSRQLEALH